MIISLMQYLDRLATCPTYSQKSSRQDINYCFNYDLSNVYEWLSANKLTLNMTKTEFMLIASRQKLSQFTESPSLTINEIAIEQVTSAKSLGVYVDQNINWECHIENISEKIACAIGAIKRIRNLTPFNVLINFYGTFAFKRAIRSYAICG